MKEQIIKVAVYDGWYTTDGDLFLKDGKIATKFNRMVCYHTSFDALIPVAKRVCEELRGMGAFSGRIHAIGSILSCNINTPISDLFAAVVAGIDIINSHKNKTNDSEAAGSI